ncbi:MAG: cell envelope integrity protein TolA [Burkholderiaceae bacterium]|nr:cell envelope integrity protein TolA [Burkholderiaceae bacterium]
MSLASDRPEFMPPAPPGRLRAIILALLAHVILIAALTWGVSWKRESSSTPVQAELWSATTQVAAPALVEPAVQPAPQPEPKPVPVSPPPPKPVPAPPAKPVPPKVVAPPPEPVIDPQIAIEQEKKKKADKQKAEKKKTLAEAKAKAEAEAKAEEARQEALDKKKRLEAMKLDAKKLEARKAVEAKAKASKEAKETAQLEAIRAANMKRIAGLAGASGAESATGSAKQSSGPSPGYGGRVSARIKPNIVFSDDIAGNPTATLEVRTSPDGTIVGRKLIKSSGVKAWDDAVLRAVDKTEVLPRDTDGRVPPSFEINFRPKD